MEFTYYDKKLNENIVKNFDIEGLALAAINLIDNLVDDEIISKFWKSEVRSSKAIEALHDEVLTATYKELAKFL